MLAKTNNLKSKYKKRNGVCCGTLPFTTCSSSLDHTYCLDKSEFIFLCHETAVIGSRSSLSSSSDTSITCCPPTPRPSTQAAHPCLSTIRRESLCSVSLPFRDQHKQTNFLRNLVTAKLRSQIALTTERSRKYSISSSIWTEVQWKCVHSGSCVQVGFDPFKPLRIPHRTQTNISR